MSDDIHEVYAVSYAEPRAQALGELHLRRPARRDDLDLLLRLGDQGAARRLRGRHRLRRSRRPRSARAQIIHPVGEGLKALGVEPDKVRQRHRHPHALGSRRQLRPVPQRALSRAGYRDGLRHRPLHVPPDAAHPVQRGRRARHGEQGLRLSLRIPRRRRGAGARHHRAQDRRPLQGPAMRAGEDQARLSSSSPPTASISTRTSTKAACSRSPIRSATRSRATRRSRSSPPRASTSCRATIRTVLKIYPAAKRRPEGLGGRLDVEPKA